MDNEYEEQIQYIVNQEQEEEDKERLEELETATLDSDDVGAEMMVKIEQHNENGEVEYKEVPLHTVLEEGQGGGVLQFIMDEDSTATTTAGAAAQDDGGVVVEAAEMEEVEEYGNVAYEVTEQEEVQGVQEFVEQQQQQGGGMVVLTHDGELTEQHHIVEGELIEQQVVEGEVTEQQVIEGGIEEQVMHLQEGVDGALQVVVEHNGEMVEQMEVEIPANV